MADDKNQTRPEEVLAIASQLFKLIGESVSCSDEVLIAALKVTAQTIEEARGAQFSAQMRAGILMQYRPK